MDSPLQRPVSAFLLFYVAERNNYKLKYASLREAKEKMVEDFNNNPEIRLAYQQDHNEKLAQYKEKKRLLESTFQWFSSGSRDRGRGRGRGRGGKTRNLQSAGHVVQPGKSSAI